MKDEIYDPVAGILLGQIFQGGCRQKEVVGGGGGEGGRGSGGRLDITGGGAMSQRC